MKIWIDVLDASGNRYGDGPITTATNWTSTLRLDAAGTFSFTMPASDPILECSDHTALLQHKRIVRCWTVDEDGHRELGAGIVERLSIEPQPKGPTLLVVEGDDLLRELANRTVGDLALYQDNYYTSGVVMEMTDGVTSWPITVGMEIDLGTAPRTFLYIKYPRQFTKISIEFSQYNAVDSDSLSIQHLNLNDGFESWEEVPGLENDTSPRQPLHPGEPDRIYYLPFSQNGSIVFGPPPEWKKEGDHYAIRLSDGEFDLDPFIISSISIVITEPVSDGLQRIMALAPTGWTLDPIGEFATAQSVYMSFAGESVLAALIALAQQTGEHFVLSPTARRVWWIGPVETAPQIAARSSGLHAIQGVETDDDTMLITNLSRTSDSYELYTRSYAKGGGIGSGRQSMAQTTHSHAGYTLDPVNGDWLEDDASVAIYGRIDYREDHVDIAPTDASAEQIINAANTLYDRVYQALRRKSQLQFAYSLAVVPSAADIWPGQTVRVTYHEWKDGYHAVSIDTDLWVLERTQAIGVSGVRLVDLTVSTIDYWPDNDARAVAQTMGDVQVARSTELPATGYTSMQAGTPVGVNVKNGQVVSLSRVIPVPDGQYRLRDYDAFKTQGGLITYLYPRVALE